MNAYDYKTTLDALGINIPALGCVMLDVEPIQADIHPADLYRSEHPDRWWIKGRVEKSHLTLLYGLLQPGPVWREHIDTVMRGIHFGPVEIESWSAFPSSFEDEPYSCIIGHVKKTPSIMEAHARLSFLPHIDTHPEYKPHVTLAYVKREAEHRTLYNLAHAPLPLLQPIGLNYGGDRAV